MVSKVLSGVGLLIMLYLFLKNSAGTTKIVNALGTTSIQGIKTLQGR